MSACKKGFRSQQALKLLQELQGQGFKPDAICYASFSAAIIDAWQIASQLQHALQRLAELLRQELKPDAMTYNAAISAW